MARAPAMDPHARRAAIVGGARRVFSAGGYHNTGIADIVAEVGIARGTFYRYFDSKRAVFQTILEEMTQEVVSVVEPIDVAEALGPQVLANLDRLVRKIMAEDVCRVLFGEAIGFDVEADEVMRSFYGDALHRIEVALQTGQRLGLVRSGDVALKARCLLGLIKEPVIQAALQGQDLDTDQLVNEILQLLQDGVLRSP